MTRFYSKLLLFGEFTIINGSAALATTYSAFSGNWTKTVAPHPLHQPLQNFIAYLLELQHEAVLNFTLNTSLLKKDAKNGLLFQSDIPQGYGLGSSGALCAALYAKYSIDPILAPFDEDKIIRLRTIFAQMESHFHGSSSGIDPLICYLNQPLLFRTRTEADLVDFPDYSTGKGGLFLLDSKQPRQTGPLVNFFVTQSKNKDFSALCQREIIPYTNACIQAFLQKDIPTLHQNIRLLSAFQAQYFKPMVPDFIQPYFKKGLETDAYTLKIFGAGGGGFFLGFTHNFKAVQTLLKDFPLYLLYRF